MDPFVRQLEIARAALYVPRPEAERAFDDLFEEEGPVALFLAGPGGIGKSTLLAHFGRAARQRGVTLHTVDLRDLPPRPAHIRPALADLEEGSCVLIDGFEEHASLESRYFSEWLPALPRSCRIVLAGRREPDPGVLRGTGWWTLLRLLRLREMSDAQARELLRNHGVSESGLAPRITAGQGHPLTLARLAAVDFLPAGEVTDAWLTETLLGALTERRERAVLALALADGCDRSLLSRLVDAGESDGESTAVEALERWLRVQPFVALGENGWVLHRCYSEAVLRQARRVAPGVYRSMLRAAADHLAERLSIERGPDARRAILRRAFAMTRHQAPATDALPYPERPRTWDRFTDGDRKVLLEAVRRHEGPESAGVLAHHMDRRADRISVLRAADGAPQGFLCELDRSDVAPDEPGFDPGVAALVDGPDEGPVRMVRHWMCVEHHQQPCPTSAEAIREFVAHAYERADLAHHLVVDPGTPTAGAGAWVAQDTVSVVDAHAFDEDGRAVRLVGWDLRAIPFPERLRHVMLLHLGEGSMANSATSTGPPASIGTADPPSADAIPAFDDEVGRALRHFHEDEWLADSALVALVPGAQDTTVGRATALREWLQQGARLLPATARFDTPGVLLQRTYFTSPVRKQLRIASELGMADSTFRRHLADARRSLARLLREGL